MNKRGLLALFLLLGLILPPPAQAYLDPGTGSMLVSALIGISATLFFLLKNFYYKIVAFFYQLGGRSVPRSAGSIVLYCEGKQYWPTFKPVLEALEERGQQAVYLASDAEDPGLNREWKHIETRCIGMGNRGFAVLNMLEADVCVMTTPGLDVLQIRRSPGVKHYAHLVHSITDTAFYKLYSFDYFDSVLCSSPHQITSLRHLEKLRGTKEKLLLKTGCCYMDELADQLSAAGGFVSGGQSGPRILLAPTWGNNGLLTRFGLDLLLPLAEAGYEVTVRPHPQSFISEKGLMEELQSALKGFSNLKWDREASPLEAMRHSDVLISDLSGIVFDYALILERPVITVDFTPDVRGKDAADLPWTAWELEVLPRLGAQLLPKDLAQLPQIIGSLPPPSAFAQNMRALRAECLYNFCKSGKVAAAQLIDIQRALAVVPNSQPFGH